jgi:predicted polyphosphate/ATP-dependent NAD kinase
MHSAVFATGPEAAGRLAASYLAGTGGAAGSPAGAEVMDADEDALRAGGTSARLFGYALVPYERGLVQHAKAGSPAGGDEAAALDATCRRVAAGLDPGRLHLVGPGRTAKRVLRHLGLGEGALLASTRCWADGLPAVIWARGDAASHGPAPQRWAGSCWASWAARASCWGVATSRSARRWSAALAGGDALTVVASASKILALAGRPLLVDTGDPEYDRALAGYLRVRTVLMRRWWCAWRRPEEPRGRLPFAAGGARMAGSAAAREALGDD